MATYTIDKIGYNGNTYLLQDSGALQLTGGNVTGPVNFGSSVSMDEATIGDLVVNGAASFTNNLQANTINGVTVGSSPKFTDTVYSHPSHTAYSSGLYKITVNNLGHVTAATAVAKADITGLGIPGSDTNTWRAIQVNGTDILGTGTNTNKLNLKAGSNVTITNSNGTVTIASSYTDTNTHYTANLITGASATATSNAANTTTNSIFLNLIENSTVRNSHNIVGSGATTVSCDANGKITISSTDTNTDTNTHYTTHLRTASSATSTSQVTAATTNPYLNLLDDSTVRDSVRLVGSGATSITTSADGKTITISSTDTNTDTNTHNTSYLYAGASNGSANAATTTGNTYLINVDGGSATSRVKLVPGSNMSITSDANGNVTFTATDTTYTLSGLGGVGTVTASGTAPLTLSASKSGTTVTITGSISVGTGSNQVAAGNHTHSGYASSTHTHSEYVPMSSTSVDVKSDAFRIRNNQSSATAAAGTNPYVTSLLLGDGREATFDEYGDGYLAIHGKSGIFLHPQSTAISAYDATATYSVGTVVWYDRKYYRCTTAITTAEAWTSGHWTNISASAGNVKVHGDVLPTVTTTYSLGSSSLKWNNVYTNTINGTTVPSSPKFTDTNYYHSSGSWSGLTYTATSNGGAGTLAFTLPTGTTSTTVAVGNHTHDYSSTYAAKSHTHGNLSNDGKITSTATIANGDKIVIVDSDTTAASKITGSSITFDGSTTTKALSQKGTWETFSKFSGSYNDLTNKPTIPTITLNGSSTTSPSFYAPTSAGTSGYYLKSNGSGAPTWAQISTTDTKVTQAYSTASSSYPLLMTATAGTSSTASRGDTTAILNNGLYYTPSSQKLTVGMSVKINNWTWTGEQTSGHLSLIYA